MKLTGLIISIAVYVAATCLVIASINARSMRGQRSGGFSFGSVGTITYGTRYHYNDAAPAKSNCGDVNNNTWADNDLIYNLNDDATVWSTTSLSCPQAPVYGINLGSLDGFTPSLTGTQVNTMYPAWQNVSSGTVKSSGLISISGVLYMAISQQFYGATYPAASGVANVQTAYNGQILKSSDHGLTWLPDHYFISPPMFPNGPNAIPSFFQYGKDYVGQTADRSNQYVYEVSAIGYQNGLTAGYGCWNNCDQLILGRVLISDISDVSPTGGSHWSFYQGGDGNIDGNWGAWATATPILSGVCQIAGLQQPLYIAGLAGGTYVYINTYFGPGTTQSDGCTPQDGTTIWDLYLAPHPWGPWILKDHTVFAYYYTPNPISKSVSIAGDGTVTLNYAPTDAQYNFTLQPVTITQVP